jgi:uncharacterized protein YcbX
MLLDTARPAEILGPDRFGVVPASVVRISVAPVKSLALVHPDEVVLEADGVAGDRRFWLRDATGALYGGKRDGELLRIHPEWDEATRFLALRFPDGRRVEGTVELGEEVAAELYGELRPAHRVVGPWQEAISRHAGRQLELLWADRDALDRSTEGGDVSLVSRGSLERLRREVGVSDAIDGRRFRMLFEIDGVGEHEEDEWLGAEVRIGEATVVFKGDVGRCVVTSRDPDTGVVDLPTLVTLAAYRPEGKTGSLPFGIYGAVVVAGRVRLGDVVDPSLRG